MKTQTLTWSAVDMDSDDTDAVAMNRRFFPFYVSYISSVIYGLHQIKPTWGCRATMQILAFGIRPRISLRSRAFYAEGRCMNMRSGRKRFKVYTYGSGPSILLIHGFASNGARWKTLVPQLVAKGYEVQVMDAPAHGTSAGRFMSVPQFIDAVKVVLETRKQWHALVSHSMGSLAGCIAASELISKIGIGNIVLMGTFASGDNLMSKFARCLGIPEVVLEDTRKWMKAYAGRPLEYFGLDRHLDRLQLPTLLIYDQQDIVVPRREAIFLTERVPSIATMSTQRLGHQLKSNIVNERILEFIELS